jgi:hypothetical protein
MEIYECHKNAFEKVKIHLQEYKGIVVIDIRVYYLIPGNTNEWRPSHKGLCMSVDKLDDLLKGLKLAKEQLNKQAKKAKTVQPPSVR